MKIDRLETHDRYEEFTKKDQDIGACCQDLINQRPFGNNPFYIFVHSRTHEDGVTKRLLWQPRLTRPKSQTNSMLFKAYPGTDIIKVIWMIPEREMWAQYKVGNICDNATIRESIYAFEYNRLILDQKDNDDLQDWQVDQIYREISQQAKTRQTKQMISAALSSSLEHPMIDPLSI